MCFLLLYVSKHTTDYAAPAILALSSKVWLCVQLHLKMVRRLPGYVFEENGSIFLAFLFPKFTCGRNMGDFFI